MRRLLLVLVLVGLCCVSVSIAQDAETVVVLTHDSFAISEETPAIV